MADPLRTIDRDVMIAELKRDESLRLTVYDDATGAPLKPGKAIVGHPTIGIGRALDVRGITPEEALYLLGNDIDSFTLGLSQAYIWFSGLDGVRQRVMLNMVFNLGFVGLSGFHDMIRYMQDMRFELAAKAMEDSAWYRQDGPRAVRLVAMMRTGQSEPPSNQS